MSNISSRHSVVPFVAGKTLALSGQRLAKIGYKHRTQDANNLKSVAVSVPYLQASDVVDNLNALLPHIGDMLENVQDKIIRSLYESTGGVLSSVGNEEISVAQCVSYLNAQREGDRLTKEAISAWFEENLAENLATFIKTKNPVLTDVMIEERCKAFSTLLQSLSGGRTQIEEKFLKNAEFAIAQAAENTSGIEEKLLQRIANIRTSQEKDAKKLETLLDFA
jgi:hypothetical protein